LSRTRTLSNGAPRLKTRNDGRSILMLIVLPASSLGVKGCKGEAEEELLFGAWLFRTRV
jgi:hypothetical protein